jgi:multiple sugar transport system substrate-binding protein
MREGRMLRRRELLIAGALGAAGLAGCGRAGEGVREVAGSGGTYRGRPVKLSYWTGFTGDDGPTMQALVDRFNREEPRIDVAMNVILWNDFYQKVPAAVYSGNGPDVGVMQVDQIPINAAHQIILPVDDVARRLRIDEREFPRDVIRASTYRGRRYGIPLDLHPLGLYYNKAALDKAGLPTDRPPADRDEYLQALDELKGKGIQGSWVSPFLFTGVLQFQSLLFQFGGNLFSADGSRATWAEDPGVEALQFMVDLVRKGHSPANVAQDADNIAFLNGQNAFIWNGPWAINQYAGQPDFDWGAAPLPKIGSRRAAWTNSHQFVVMRQAHDDPDRMEAAVRFIDWLSRNSAAWATSGMIPARASERRTPTFRKLKAQAAFAREVDAARFPPAVPGAPDVRVVTLDIAVQDAVLGRQAPRAALHESAKAADALLDVNREKFGEV